MPLAAAEPPAAPPETVQVSGYGQVDWVVHDQLSQNDVNHSTELPLNRDRFVLRRGRLRVDATRGPLGAVVELDANTVNGPQVRPVDVEIFARWPEKAQANLPVVEIAAGLMRIPFGFELR